MKIKNITILLALISLTFTNQKADSSQITTLVAPAPGALVQSTQVLSQPAPAGIFARKNLRVSPLETLTPISVGGNKAETNPLISESNREMLNEFQKGKETFQEQPILANNRMAIPLSSIQVIPSQPMVTQTVISQQAPSIAVVPQDIHMVSPQIVGNIGAVATKIIP